MRRAFAALAVGAMPLGASAATPLEMPVFSSQVPAIGMEALRQTVTQFNTVIGGYPPRLASDAQRQEVYQRWVTALQQTWLLEEREPESEDVLLLLSELYRQGHNMDVRGAGERADKMLQRCIRLHPDSMGCHFSASYFYLSVNPSFASKGEASLRKLRALYAPQRNAEVERGFVFAYLYQGRKDEALKQLDVVLSLDPQAEWALRMREGLRDGELSVQPSR